MDQRPHAHPRLEPGQAQHQERQSQERCQGHAAGTISGTLALLVTTTLLGVFGSGIYLVLRHLMIGPRWFQVVSISGGPAIVVGSILVHTDGIDFTLLQPVQLAITLFVVIPLVYAVLLTLLAEQLLAPEGWFARAPRLLALARC